MITYRFINHKLWLYIYMYMYFIIINHDHICILVYCIAIYRIFASFKKTDPFFLQYFPGGKFLLLWEEVLLGKWNLTFNNVMISKFESFFFWTENSDRTITIKGVPPTTDSFFNQKINLLNWITKKKRKNKLKLLQSKKKYFFLCLNISSLPWIVLLFN